MTEKINGAIEFISTKGERGGIDAQITDWVEANPDSTIVGVKYRVAVYQDGGKNKLAKLALVLFNKGKSGASKTISKKEGKSETKIETEGPGARTMVMNLRRDLNLEDAEE